MAELQPSGGDDAAVIQAALDQCDLALGYGTFNVSAPLTLKKCGTRFRGRGAGFAVSGPAVPTIINYTGPDTPASLLFTVGQLSDLDVGGFFLACNGRIGGMTLSDFSGSRFDRIKIMNPRSNTSGLAIIGGGAPTGHYNVFNKFGQISIALLSPYSTGVYADGNYAAINDTWITSFELVRVETAAGATGAVCMWLRFIDSCTFTRCHISPNAEPTSHGLILDAMGNHNYPSGNAFHDCSIYGPIIVYEDAAHKIRKNYFLGFGTYDNETVPTHPSLIGFTDQGVKFNGFQ